MKPYHTEPALRGASGTGIIRIGVICHETGHFFGLPDLYDTSYLTDGLGNWCIMSGGSWNWSSGSSPAHFSAWCKVNLGFAKPMAIHSKSGVSLTRVEDNAVVGMLRDGMSNGEYFLIENRAKFGYDNTSQIYPGLLVYHIAGNSSGNNSSSHPHPLVRIEEADGDASLGFAQLSSSEAGDVWTITSGLTGGWRDQTGNSNTSAMLYQTNTSPYQTNLFYDRPESPARYTYNRLANFSAAASNMTFNAQSLKTDAPTQNALPPNYTVAWAAASEAAKYEIQEGTRVTLTSLTDGAEDGEAMYENWYLGGKVQRVLTNASYAGSYSYALLSGNGSVHHLTMQKPFKATTNSLISFRFKSHISAGNGYLKFQISKDAGVTWNTLLTTNGNVDSWSLQTNNYAALNTKGISAGDSCIIRFLADIESGSGLSSYPAFGFALDDISITGVEMAGYGNWTTLNNNVATNFYPVTGKTNSIYAYRIQAYANGAWQGYGSVGETTVSSNHAPVWTVNPIVNADANIGAAYNADLGALATDEVNDVVTFSMVSGPAWLSVFSDGILSGTPQVGSAGTNNFTVRVTDSSGAYNDATLMILVNTPLAYTSFANWRLNESSGPTLHDSVSNFNGTAVGSLVYGAAGAPNGGTSNYAVGFDGSTTAVSIPALNLNTNTLTMTALIKRNGTQNTSAGIFFWRSAAGFGLRFADASTSPNQIAFVWNGSVWTTSLIVPDNQWTFVAASVGPAGTTIYMATNSTVSTSAFGGAFDAAAFNSAAYLGYDTGGATRRFNGAMDDAAIYGRTLSSSEINQLAAAAFAQAAPVVTVATPTNGAVLTNLPVTVSASVVSNTHSIVAVRFYAGLNLLGEDTTPPYTFNWSGMTNGIYALSAKAIYDGANLISSMPITSTVTNAVATNPTNIFATVSSNNLSIISWPGDHTGWILQAQTNSPSVGLGTNWVDVPGSSSVIRVTNVIQPTNGSVFYRLKYSTP